MKRLLCGSVVLAASLVLVSCSSDPTGDFRGTPTRISAEPTSLFLDQAANADVIVTLLDDQGDPLPGAFEVTAQGNGITVAKNENFLGTTTGVPLESQAQFIVTAGDTPTPTSFTLTSGELSIDIPVKVMPTEVPTAAFSNPAPGVNDTVTVTAEGYSFLPSAAISFGGDSAIIVANDGTTLTFLPLPGSTGPALLEGIAIDFLPTTPLSLQTTSEISVAAFTGTESTATAPAIPVPAAGDSTLVLFDNGTFTGLDITGDGGIGAQYYQFTVTEAGDYRFITDWSGDADIDAIVCFDAACAGGAFAGSGLTHPEDGTLTLAPGTYYFVAVLFAGAATPFFLTIDR